jgi:hypothetical protein
MASRAIFVVLPSLRVLREVVPGGVPRHVPVLLCSPILVHVGTQTSKRSYQGGCPARGKGSEVRALSNTSLPQVKMSPVLRTPRGVAADRLHAVLAAFPLHDNARSPNQSLGKFRSPDSDFSEPIRASGDAIERAQRDSMLCQQIAE